jgi:hypothetical protein
MAYAAIQMKACSMPIAHRAGLPQNRIPVGHRTHTPFE